MARKFVSASNQQFSVGAGIASGVPFTIACTVNLSALTNEQYIWSIGSDGNGIKWYALIYNAAGNLFKVTYHDGSTADVLNFPLAGSIATGTIYRIVFVAEALDQRRGNINNSGIESNDTTSMGAITNQRFTVGCYRDDIFGQSNFADADISEVAFWDVTLDGAERAAYMKGISPALIRPQSLQGYWPLRGETAPEPDYGRGNNPLNQGNNPTKADHPSMFYGISARIGELLDVATTYALIIDLGTYAHTGVAAALKASRNLALDVGQYNITGTAASLLYGLYIALETGVYTITGSVATFSRRFVEQYRVLASYVRSKILKGSI